ncbi:hydroxymethylglutaryl-CoA lyase [Desulfomonile tiedjei]|uniref:Isopropylmalate/homocitrate/citramalate synthase n=1 Tax=Desulfomonile tiedjei (strain ATCC 49306 / DSM 6799 / DCB-1) TaxID=706587 RepID=I4C8S1_DESTA|nr:hydroxymethylglutaryl-CoA lyase [Desulfomonile tiedjei]AFM25962.1 isopropylmalate/homocitrate/citramalate synthase [Desulfomonile tiedjei DSM 6799]
MNSQRATVTNEVLIQEVGLRDGLQNEPRILQPGIRAHIADLLGDAGIPRIQIGSFVNPKRVPQMAGTAEVWHEIRRKPGVRYSALVLNARGLDQAIACGIPHVEIYVSVSETHSLKNSGIGTEEALEAAALMIDAARSRGLGVTAGLMCAFGCFYEGKIDLRRVLDMVSRLRASSLDEIGLADTSGMGDPESIGSTLEAVAELMPLDEITLHLHDTRGLGIQNMVAGLTAGVRRFDASVGGLGGCPFIPGAVGNIATERVVQVLHSMRYSTGIMPESLALARERVFSALA